MKKEMPSEKDFFDILTLRRNYLRDLIREKQQALKSVPEGYLRVSERKTHAEYYWRKDPDDSNGRFIKQDQMELARRLAQKGYDSSIESMARKEEKLASNYLKYVSKNSISGLYEELSRGRRALITPEVTPKETFVR